MVGVGFGVGVGVGVGVGAGVRVGVGSGVGSGVTVGVGTGVMVGVGVSVGTGVCDAGGVPGDVVGRMLPGRGAASKHAAMSGSNTASPIRDQTRSLDCDATRTELLGDRLLRHIGVWNSDTFLFTNELGGLDWRTVLRTTRIEE